MTAKPKARTYAGEKRVAVVVPIHKEGLTGDERISISHLMHFLGVYDKYIVSPDNLNVSLPDFEVKRFGPEFFLNTLTYSALLLSRDFYQTFGEYEFILVYQLDALVFSDQLLEWCERGWDYIGAPWIKSREADFVEESRVGNGGFSLRRVASFLRVIDSPGFHLELDRYQSAFNRDIGTKEDAQASGIRERIARRLRFFENREAVAKDIARRAKTFGMNEDYFWSFKAVKYYPDFKIATVEDGLRFAFEVRPRQCYELNNRQLPFGCHAWNKYDPNFWKPFLLR
ncbi:MAG TPA: DUF5672 family protein [Pyrinomonadaceae bacterium]|jgi:hypothetical protein